MKLTRWIPLLLPLAMLTACSSSSSYLARTTRMMSSETEGQFGLSGEAGIHNLNRVYITDDISSTSINDSGHHMEDMITTGIDGNFGLLDFLDVGLTYDIGVPPMAFAKLQLIGDSKREAEADNFSFSVYGSLGYDSAFTDTDSNTDIFTGQTPGGVVHRNGHGVYEAGGIFGYRTSRNFIFLVGGSVLWQEIGGSQVMAPGDTPISFDDHSRFTEFHAGGIIHFGTNVNQGFFLTPMAQWGYIDTFGYRFYGMNVQANFGYKFR